MTMRLFPGEGEKAVRPTQNADPLPGEMRAHHRNAQLILVMRGLRSIAYGLLAVILGVALAGEGFSPVSIGVLITVSLLGDMLSTYVIGLLADIWGRRRILALLALLMAATGVVFWLVTNYSVLLLTAFFGTLGASASETAPFLPIDQAMLAQITPPERRTALFARYNLVAQLCSAGGALAAGLPVLLTGPGLPLASGVRLLFAAYAMLGLAVAGLSQRLSPLVEAPRPSSIEVQSLRQRLHLPLVPLAWHRVAPDCSLQRRCAGRRLSGAEPGGALFPRALRRATRHAIRPVLWREPLLSALIPGRSSARPAFRPAQHYGLHTPALERPTGSCGFRARFSPRSCAAPPAPDTLPDGCAHPASLHDGSGRPAGAHSRCQRHLPGS